MEEMGLEVARYYDVAFDLEGDIDFYTNHISSDGTVLELGSGTGRVLIPLARKCASIVGVDMSQAMIDICKEKLKRTGISQADVTIHHGDVTCLQLNQKFDLIIAPLRVFQSLEDDEEVDAFFSVIRDNLAPNAFCILNVFNPNAPFEQLISDWEASSKNEEILAFEKPYDRGLLKHSSRRVRLCQEPLIVYTELMFRYYENAALVSESSFEAPMRVYYPEEFIKVVTEHNFIILDCWGGYAGEKYGEGSELVLKFRDK